MLKYIWNNRPIYPLQKPYQPNSKRNGLTFGTHEEYLARKKDRPHFRVSNFFRRDSVFDKQYEEFKYVENAIQTILKEQNKPKMLVVGLGTRAQELLSNLAVIKEQRPNTPLSESVDVYCVDLQPKLPVKDLKYFGLFDVEGEPMFAKSSFDYIENSPFEPLHYKVKSEITNFAEQIFNNPSKAKWDTKIEDFAAKAPDKSFDIISINNVYHYIKQDDRLDLAYNLERILKNGGTLITDPGVNYAYIKKGLNALHEWCGIWLKPL